MLMLAIQIQGSNLKKTINKKRGGAMIVEKLALRWPCNCASHNCVVIEDGSDVPAAEDLKLFAVMNKAHCVCEQGHLVSTFFIRVNGIQRAMGNEELVQHLETLQK
jgi:hypothetical protein